MSDINIGIEGGKSKRLLTTGKYCDRDIVVSAEGGGVAIVDVVELPTESINEDVFYRLLTAEAVYNQYVQNSWTYYCVETLPEVGEPVTLDQVKYTVYHNVSDNTSYGYISDALAPVFGVPAGWYTAEMLLTATGESYAGVVIGLENATLPNTYYTVLSYVNYTYKDGWTKHKNIGWVGTGTSAETFNHPSNIASGDVSHAEGYKSHAEGYASHAEGYKSHAAGDYSHAEGSYSRAEGITSHAEGDISVAEGYASHAEGCQSHAEGDYSHAEGYQSHAAGRSQHAQGEFNVQDPEYNQENKNARGKYAHIVGNGTSHEARSNAHTLDWGGVAWFQGRPQFGGNGQDDNSQTVMANGDTELVIKSPNGTPYRITVSDDGSLQVTAV